MGEYARSLAVARGLESRWPDASIHFVLSRAAPYAAQAPYPTTLLDSSPTFHTAAVARLIGDFAPDVVIFDNAGRTAQLRAARRSGARVVFISARRRQRRRAFRLRWMAMLDEHWIAYPMFLAGPPSFLERLKLAIMRRPTIRYLDVILDNRRANPGAPVLRRLALTAGDYVLVVPGGGTGHPGAGNAAAVFREAAHGIAASGVATVFVGGTATPGLPGMAAAGAFNDPGPEPRLRELGPLPQPDLAQLMRGARLIVVNGGSTLLQAIACGKPCLAIAIAGDQHERIRRCVRAGVAVTAVLDSAAMLRAAGGLLRDAQQLDALAGRAIAVGLTDGIGVALRAVSALIADPAG